MTRIEQTVRLADTLAEQIDRGVKNPNQMWIFNTWLRRRSRPRWDTYQFFGASDITDYDLTLVHQMEYALAHLDGEALRRQGTELLAATTLA